MLWPFPINVRMNPFLANSLLDINTQCATEEREIFDFPEYQSQLNPGQLVRLRAFALEVIRSHDSQSPIAAISIIGHADRALKEPVDQRTAKEQSVSEARGNVGRAELEKMIKSLDGGNRVWAQLLTKAEGVGSKDLAVQNPLNDFEMRRNRRIVFKWSRCLLPAPIIHPQLDLPLPIPNFDDDPNTIFAGTQFKMKILSGVSAGELAGGCSYQLQIVDPVNKRSCEYHYAAIIATVGVPPFSECGESDFSKEFTTKKPLQVDQFDGEADHTSGSVGAASAMRFSFGAGATYLRIDPSQIPITMFAGPSKSLGAETGITGQITKIAGTVRVVK